MVEHPRSLTHQIELDDWRAAMERTASSTQRPPQDSRIETIAKALFTGPLVDYDDDRWESSAERHVRDRRLCHAAAEDVLSALAAAEAVDER